SGGMCPWFTMTTGKGPGPSGSEIVPVIGWPPLVQATWYFAKPAPRVIRSPIEICPAAGRRARRDSMKNAGTGGAGVADGEAVERAHPEARPAQASGHLAAVVVPGPVRLAGSPVGPTGLAEDGDVARQQPPAPVLLDLDQDRPVRSRRPAALAGAGRQPPRLV